MMCIIRDCYRFNGLQGPGHEAQILFRALHGEKLLRYLGPGIATRSMRPHSQMGYFKELEHSECVCTILGHEASLSIIALLLHCAFDIIE